MSKLSWVTGGHGFIGRHLSKYLNRLGHTVASIGHGTWSSDNAKQWGIHYWIEADIGLIGFDSLCEKVGKPDYIYHIAGGSSVGIAMQVPLNDFERTVQSTAQLLEWVRTRSNQSKVILSSSAAIYGAGFVSPISENDSISPFSPYGYNKRMAELLLHSYARNFGIKAAIVRLFSVYGPELKKQILWDVLNRLADSPHSLEMFGTGKETRDFLHISDAVRLLKTAEEYASDEVVTINGGTGNACTISHLVHRLCKVNGSNVSIHFNGQQRSGDPKYLVANTELARQLGFEPEIDLTTGLKEYTAWFQHHLSESRSS